MHTINDDIESILGDDLREARHRILRGYVLIPIAGGVVVAAGYYLVTDWGFLSAVIAGCLTAWGLWFLTMLMHEGLVSPGDFKVSDDTLRKLAAITASDNEHNLENLRSLLRNQGFLTIGQITDFIRDEKRAKEKHTILSSPGAKALLGDDEGN
jgi:hypothetical protein